MIKRKEDVKENFELDVSDKINDKKIDNSDFVLNEEDLKKEEAIEAEVLETKEELNATRKDSDGFVIASEEETVDENAPEYAKDVDDARLHYLGLAKKMKYLNIGIMIAVIIGVVLSFVLLIGKKTDTNHFDIIGIVLVFVLLIGVLVYNFFAKRFLNSKAFEYINVYYKKIISTIFDENEFLDVQNSPKGKIDPELFKQSRVFVGIKSIGSRNVTYLKHNGEEVMICDASAEIQGPKRLEPVFLGKFIHHENKLDFPGRIIISVKGKSKFYVKPTDVEGLSVLADTDKYIVYSNYEKANRIITKNILAAISRFETNENLIDVFISVIKGHTFIGIDLSDKEMNIPVDAAFNIHSFDKLKENVLRAIDIVEAINSNIVLQETVVEAEVN